MSIGCYSSVTDYWICSVRSRSEYLLQRSAKDSEYPRFSTRRVYPSRSTRSLGHQISSRVARLQRHDRAGIMMDFPPGTVFLWYVMLILLPEELYISYYLLCFDISPFRFYMDSLCTYFLDETNILTTDTIMTVMCTIFHSAYLC